MLPEWLFHSIRFPKSSDWFKTSILFIGSITLFIIALLDNLRPDPRGWEVPQSDFLHFHFLPFLGSAITLAILLMVYHGYRRSMLRTIAGAFFAAGASLMTGVFIKAISQAFGLMIAVSFGTAIPLVILIYCFAAFCISVGPAIAFGAVIATRIEKPTSTDTAGLFLLAPVCTFMAIALCLGR